MESAVDREQLNREQVYQGQFGDFTITAGDRRGVIVYRSALMVAALCFAASTGLTLWQPNSTTVQWAITSLFGGFSLAMGIALFTIHIYMRSLHRTLQLFWGIGSLTAIILAVLFSPSPLAIVAYQQPLSLLGIGFSFAALTGLFIKEAFCFNRLETKALTPIVPLLLLGHLLGFLPKQWELLLLVIWAVLFVVFAVRKAFQPIPPDIGDKSVFDYLAKVRRGEIVPDAA